MTQGKRRPGGGKPPRRPQPQLLNKRGVSVKLGGKLTTRRSYEYGWNDLEEQTFDTLGVIARRAPDGSARFNFSQRVWLDPGISMDWAERPTLQVLTLAENILTRFERHLRLDPSIVRRAASQSAAQFADLFLCTMPYDGGCIPTGVIRAWLRSARDRRRPLSRATARLSSLTHGLRE